MYYWYWIEEFYRDLDWYIPSNKRMPNQKVVVATINRSLSRKREQESEPARLVHHLN